MTDDLWMILVLLDVIIVLAVVLYNWWQERKYRKDVEFSFSQPRNDVLDSHPAATPAGKKSQAPVAEKTPISEEMEGWMSEPRVKHAFKREPAFSVAETASPPEPAADEPEFRLGAVRPPAEIPAAVDTPVAAVAPAAVIAVPAAPVTEVLPELGTAVASPPALPADEEPVIEEVIVAAPVAPALVLPDALHVMMDLIAIVDAPSDLTLSTLEAWKAEMRSFPQQTQLWVYSAASGWLNLLQSAANPLHAIHYIACSLQLADRAGPVDVLTLNRFEKSVDSLARSLGVEVQWQGDYAAEAQAHALDAFCIEVDKAVEFHVLATQGMFHATKLRGLAESSGLQLNARGRYELLNAEGQLAFSVRNYEGKDFSADMLKSAVMTGVTFQLDIPTTSHNVEVFDHMVEVASALAINLNGVMMDVNRKPIGDIQLDKIRQQIQGISNRMAEHGIAPGSQHASRLFN